MTNPFLQGIASGLHSYAQGGIIPAQSDTMPNMNGYYPLSNMQQHDAAYAPKLSFVQPSELLGSDDANIDPFTGEEKFDEGGAVAMSSPTTFARFQPGFSDGQNVARGSSLPPPTPEEIDRRNLTDIGFDPYGTGDYYNSTTDRGRQVGFGGGNEDRLREDALGGGIGSYVDNLNREFAAAPRYADRPGIDWTGSGTYVGGTGTGGGGGGEDGGGIGGIDKWGPGALVLGGKVYKNWDEIKAAWDKLTGKPPPTGLTDEEQALYDQNQKTQTPTELKTAPTVVGTTALVGTELENLFGAQPTGSVGLTNPDGTPITEREVPGEEPPTDQPANTSQPANTGSKLTTDFSSLAAPVGAASAAGLASLLGGGAGAGGSAVGIYGLGGELLTGSALGGAGLGAGAGAGAGLGAGAGAGAAGGLLTTLASIGLPLGVGYALYKLAGGGENDPLTNPLTGEDVKSGPMYDTLKKFYARDSEVLNAAQKPMSVEETLKLMQDAESGNITNANADQYFGIGAKDMDYSQLIDAYLKDGGDPSAIGAQFASYMPKEAAGTRSANTDAEMQKSLEAQLATEGRREPPIDAYAGGDEYYNQLYGEGMAAGGLASLPEYKAGGLLHGPGDGMSDSIPAVIKGEQPQRAALADGEFVVPADVVSHLGNGSTKAGSARLYEMMDKIRHARTGNSKQGKKINPHKFLPV